MKALLRKIRGSFATSSNLRKNASKSARQLEIGPGPERIPGFETLNIVPGRNVDYVCDATGTLPFPSNTFELVYASHIIEHVPWFQVAGVLKEWTRILKPGGRLEIWTPDGLKIAKAFVDAELNGSTEFHNDGWWRFNEGKDPALWAAGRLYTYGDGSGRTDHPNWHRALFSKRLLTSMMEGAGLADIRDLDRKEVRGHDHGWINLGLTGTKLK